MEAAIFVRADTAARLAGLALIKYSPHAVIIRKDIKRGQVLGYVVRVQFEERGDIQYLTEYDVEQLETT